jgi:hypothetical protein
MAKLRRSRRAVPSILKTPITYPRSSSFVRGTDRIEAQYDQRIQAALRFYGIDASRPDAYRELIIALGKERFPSGFLVIQEGTPISGNKPQWNVERQVQLVAFVQARRADGWTYEQAAAEYAETYALRISTKSILARFYDSLRELKRLGILEATYRKRVSFFVEWAASTLLFSV